MNTSQMAISGELVAGGTVASGQAAPAQPCTGPSISTARAALERAEPMADTHMAFRARLTDYTTRNEHDPASAQAQRRNARHARLRFGPTYTDAVSRQQCPSGSAATVARGADTSGE